MKYKKGMKIVTLEDCELPHDMRAETFTIVDSSQSDSLQVEDSRGRIMVIGKSYIDNKATKKLNQTIKEHAKLKNKFTGNIIKAIQFKRDELDKIKKFLKGYELINFRTEKCINGKSYVDIKDDKNKIVHTLVEGEWVFFNPDTKDIIIQEEKTFHIYYEIVNEKKTKSDFKKFYEFDDVNVELQFDQRFEEDDSIYFEVSGINDCMNFTLSKKETKKLIKHLQKMVDYCEE